MMLSREQSELIEPSIKTTQIICFALIAGVVVFTGIVCAITDWQAINTNIDVMSIFGLIMGFSILSMAFVVPRMMETNFDSAPMDKLSEEGKLKRLAGVYQTRTIVQFAMLEGAAFMNVMLFMITRNVLLLAFVALGLAMMAVVFPKLDTVLAWVGERAGRIIS